MPVSITWSSSRIRWGADWRGNVRCSSPGGGKHPLTIFRPPFSSYTLLAGGQPRPNCDLLHHLRQVTECQRREPARCRVVAVTVP